MIRAMGHATAVVGLLTVLMIGPGTVGIEAQLRPEGEQDRSGPSAGQAALLSAVVPGAGQYALGQRRSWVYLALETVGWALWVDRRAAGDDLRTRYRDFAWAEARLRTGARVEGDFEYYERMTKWRRSGLFDADPATEGVQPESDPATFNGASWALAAGIFLSGDGSIPETDPRYQSALDYYRDRAYGEEFLWDWTGKEAEQEEFGSLITRSDDRFRQATSILGLVLVNHAVSMVDAYVSARAPAVTVRSGFVPGSGSGMRWRLGDLQWTARVDVALPR
jgi:hypothetical protein